MKKLTCTLGWRLQVSAVMSVLSVSIAVRVLCLGGVGSCWSSHPGQIKLMIWTHLLRVRRTLVIFVMTAVITHICSRRLWKSRRVLRGRVATHRARKIAWNTGYLPVKGRSTHRGVVSRSEKSNRPLLFPGQTWINHARAVQDENPRWLALSNSLGWSTEGNGGDLVWETPNYRAGRCAPIGSSALRGVLRLAPQRLHTY